LDNIITDYISHGWSIVPIPPGSKGPDSPGWNLKTAALRDVRELAPGYGVGLMHAYSGTMALDIDDWDATVAYGLAHGFDLAAMCAAPDVVAITSGRPGRGKLLYQMPFGLVLPWKQFSIEVPGGPTHGHTKRKVIFELRCGTTEGKTVQDVLPPSIHPETGQPYQWAGTGHWSRLPMVPQAIIDLWFEALKDVRPPRVDGVDSSWEEIEGALSHINPDCSREDWIRAGMALHWAGEQTFNPGKAFEVWNGWSAKGSKYPGERAIWQQWRSFHTDKGNVVTVGTLFQLARDAGWVRPTPDAATLFSAVTPTPPTDIKQLLRPTPPAPPLDIWPPLLAQRAREVADGVGCDPLVPLWAGLGAISGAVDAQTRLELMPGFKVPPVLWLMTLGEPADKKSPGSRPMIEPLKTIERDDAPRFAQAITDWEVKEAVWSSAKDAMLKAAASPSKSLGDLPEVPPRPDMPIPVKITVQDVTSAKLVRLATERPRGMLCYLDEMNSWVAKITNKISGEDRSAWVVSYEAARYEMDRQSTGSTHCDNFAISIYGNIQPRVLHDKFADLTADGMLQRFLPAVLRGDQTRLGNPIPDHLTSADKWESTLRIIFNLPAQTYTLSPAAYEVYRAFQQWYEERKVKERLVQSSGAYMTAFGKLEGLVGRLALIFHVVEAPFTPAVSVDVMTRAIRLVKEYVIPVYRYLYDGDDTSSVTFDRWVMEYIIQHADLESITLSEVKRAGRRPFEKAGVKHNQEQNQWTLNAMYTLEQMGWVARVDDGSGEHRGSANWLINPSLKDTFREYRKAVIRAKQDVYNIIKAKRPETGRRPFTHGADELDD